MYQDFFLSFSLFKIFFLFNSLKKTHEIKKMEVGFLYWFELDTSNTLGKKVPLQPLPLAHALPAPSRTLPLPSWPRGTLSPVNAPQLPAALGGDGKPKATFLYAGIWGTDFNLFLGGHWRGWMFPVYRSERAGGPREGMSAQPRRSHPPLAP